jgi:CBS-domain-containing membrane protein
VSHDDLADRICADYIKHRKTGEVIRGRYEKNISEQLKDTASSADVQKEQIQRILSQMIDQDYRERWNQYQLFSTSIVMIPRGASNTEAFELICEAVEAAYST